MKFFAHVQKELIQFPFYHAAHITVTIWKLLKEHIFHLSIEIGLKIFNKSVSAIKKEKEKNFKIVYKQHSTP